MLNQSADDRLPSRCRSGVQCNCSFEHSGGNIISSIEGNIQGLKHNQIHRLEKLYSRRIPPREIITQEFARQLSELSHEINRQIGVLVNRKGYVETVVVGNARGIVLPDLKRVRMGETRFRGLRCLHTHLAGEELTQDDLTDLALLRLDLMAAIDVRSDGLPGLVRAAHLLPANGNPTHPAPSDPLDEALADVQPPAIWGFLDPQIPSQLDVDFIDLIESLEEELARARNVRNPRDHRDRAILVSVTTGSISAAQESLDELRELARSSGVVVLDSIVQRRQKLDPRSLLGRGKLDEIIIGSLQLGTDVIIFDQNLSPAQARVINEATDLKIIDRTQLILDIFAQRAQSREGKIQVELAQLKYMLPRLTGSGTEMSRLMGGIGGRGPGETKLEVDRRRVRDRIHHLEKPDRADSHQPSRAAHPASAAQPASHLHRRLHQRRKIDAVERAHGFNGHDRRSHVCDARPDQPSTASAARSGSHHQRYGRLHPRSAAGFDHGVSRHA